MKITLIFAVFLPLLASTSPHLVKRLTTAPGAANVISDIQQTDKDTKTFNTTLNQNNDTTPYGFYQLLAIQAQSKSIIYDIGNTTGSVNASTAFSKTDSANINTTLAQLSPDTGTTLQNLIAHYPAFKTGGVTGSILSSLQKERELTRELGNALGSKLAAPYKTAVPAAFQTVLAEFDAAIKKFSS